MKQDTETTFRVFDSIEEIDALVINKSFEEAARDLEERINQIRRKRAGT
jgi:hypothetical protein